MAIAYDKLSGDLLCRGGLAHQGSPDHRGADGLSKREVYQAAMCGDVRPFARMARAINGDADRKWLVSTRTWQRSPGKAPRPIDIPSETKRLHAEIQRERLQSRADKLGWLLPTVIGFRRLGEFPAFRDRDDGVTIQDVYGSTVEQLIENHGPFAVVIDLKDAFGNLPHFVVAEVLRGIGLNHRDRRQVVETARIRARLPDGSVLKPRAYGIEQGNPLSPLLFNLVMSRVLRSVADAGHQGASYGDDVVLVAESEVNASVAFAAFMNVTSNLGFTNVRPLGSDGKATRIYDTRVEPAPLIKTYLVCPGQVALMAKKGEELQFQLGTAPNLKTIRVTNRWKVASKSYLSTLIPATGAAMTISGGRAPIDGRPEDDDKCTPAGVLVVARPPSLLEEADGDARGGRAPGVQDQTVPESDTPAREQGARSDGSPMWACSPDKSPIEDEPIAEGHPLGLVSTSIPDPAGAPDEGLLIIGIINGRELAACEGSGPEASVTAGHPGGQGRGHRPCPPVSVLRDEDLQALRDGRRLRAGDNYRGQVIDLQGLDVAIGIDRIAHAIGQVARVASYHGRVRLLVHPGEPWPWSELLTRFGALKQEAYVEGIVLSFRRVRSEPVTRPVKAAWSPPPATDLVIRSTQCSRADRRSWGIVAEIDGRRRVLRAKATTPNRDVGAVEALAQVVAAERVATVAVPATGTLRGCLLASAHGQARVRHVGLADAVAVLRAWEWGSKGEWLVGVMSQKQPGAQCVVAFAELGPNEPRTVPGQGGQGASLAGKREDRTMTAHEMTLALEAVHARHIVAREAATELAEKAYALAKALAADAAEEAARMAEAARWAEADTWATEMAWGVEDGEAEVTPAEHAALAARKAELAAEKAEAAAAAADAAVDAEETAWGWADADQLWDAAADEEKEGYWESGGERVQEGFARDLRDDALTVVQKRADAAHAYARELRAKAVDPLLRAHGPRQ